MSAKRSPLIVLIARDLADMEEKFEEKMTASGYSQIDIDYNYRGRKYNVTFLRFIDDDVLYTNIEDDDGNIRYKYNISVYSVNGNTIDVGNYDTIQEVFNELKSLII